MIQVNHLKKEFKKQIKEPGLAGSIKALFTSNFETVTAVDAITFHGDEGDILGFISPNGACKLTVSKILTGILTPPVGT